MRRILLTTFWLLAVLALGAGPALADGIIIPVPPVEWPTMPLRSLAIKYHHVTVSIEGQVAVTRVDQVFVNESPHDLEGDYIFPLPPGASIHEFAMWVDGSRLEAQVLDADEARRIYEDIVRSRQDPALLEYAGQNAFRARVFPIPAWGEKRIEIEYSEVLPSDGGLVRYVYPLGTERFSSRPLESVRVEVELLTHSPLKTVYSPSHTVTVARQGERASRVVYAEENVTPSSDFRLYFSTSDQDVAADLLSYREGSEDGYFLLLLSPGSVAEVAQAVPKDVLIVLDTSGSMRGHKLTQAKGAVRYILDNLNSEDRFHILTFASTTHSFRRGLSGLDERDAARGFIGSVVAGGGTNMHAALTESLEQAGGDRPQVVIFVTDGLATEGEVRSEEILAAVRELAPENVRLFTFGVGYDVNTILLDTLADEQRGASSYVQPEEDIEATVSAFYDKVSQPVLTDVDLDWGDTTVDDVYPFPLPDIFGGGQIVVLGRYHEGGSVTVTLTGERDGSGERFAYGSLSLAEEGGADFIPRLWATRKIGHLLTQIRLHGPESELVDEIVELSVRYGIVTPYTSFLVDESEDALTQEGRQALADQALQSLTPPSALDGRGGGGAAAPAVSGQAAVERSVAEEALRSANAAAEPESALVRAAGAKSFVLRDGTWVDTAFDGALLNPDKVPLGSERYFALLAAHPDWNRYLALGPHVLLVWEGQAYEIVAGEVSPAFTPAPASAPPQRAWNWRWPLGG